LPAPRPCIRIFSSSPALSRSRMWRPNGARHGDVIVCATTACLRARLCTAPNRSRERQRADAQLLMTFCLEREPQRKLNLPGIFRRGNSSERRRVIRDRARQIEVCAIEDVEGLRFGGQAKLFPERKGASQGEVDGS